MVTWLGFEEQVRTSTGLRISISKKIIQQLTGKGLCFCVQGLKGCGSLSRSDQLGNLAQGKGFLFTYWRANGSLYQTTSLSFSCIGGACSLLKVLYLLSFSCCAWILPGSKLPQRNPRRAFPGISVLFSAAISALTPPVQEPTGFSPLEATGFRFI